MSSHWISNEAEEALKTAYAHYDNIMSEAEDGKTLALAMAARLSISRLIRRKPLRANECPACRRNMMIKHNFCPDCGQALDWQQEG